MTHPHPQPPPPTPDAPAARAAFARAHAELDRTLARLAAAYPDGRLVNALGAVQSTLEYLNWCLETRTEDP